MLIHIISTVLNDTKVNDHHRHSFTNNKDIKHTYIVVANYVYSYIRNIPRADPLFAAACTIISDDEGLLSIIVIVSGPPCSGII